MMSSFIMTLSLFKAPSSGGAFPFQRPAEIVGLPPFALNGRHFCEHASSNNTGNYFIYALAIDCLHGERR